MSTLVDSSVPRVTGLTQTQTRDMDPMLNILSCVIAKCHGVVLENIFFLLGEGGGGHDRIMFGDIGQNGILVVFQFTVERTAQDKSKQVNPTVGLTRCQRLYRQSSACIIRGL